MRLPLTEAIVDAARAGMGVAVLSEWTASGYLDDGTLAVNVWRKARCAVRGALLTVGMRWRPRSACWSR